MKVVKIDQKSWEEGLKKLYGAFRLIGPVKEGETGKFKVLEEGEMPDLSIQNTHLSAKSVVYSQSQVMFKYDLNENNKDHHIMKTIEEDATPQVLLAVRPCDAAAFLIAKKNFDNPDYRDPYWCETYEKTVMVGFACNNPGSTCFCTSTGIGPYSEKGLDVILIENGEDLLVKAITEKGEKLIGKTGWKTEADPGVIETLKQEAEAKISSVVDTNMIEKKSTKELFEAPFWEDVAFACINCSTCTFSCPTCWCFDIQDENLGDSGKRIRNWDSCMSPLFTLEGSGHNPRPVKFQRVRQRFMHKLKYYVDKYEDGIQCVGCGRCIKLCPVNIDIRNVSQKMNNYNP
ncbi:4Fe-4S dicluster domain-containing protein [bacterium]|nr:4Fe-4S dicluster domain-containing protein [bacterium]